MYPVLFELAGVRVSSYGVFSLLSYLTFTGLLFITAKRLERSFGEAAGMALAMLAGALVGGWLPVFLLGTEVLVPTALAGGVLAPVLLALILRRPIGTALDLVTPAMLGAWAVGNLACLLAGCCWGPVTSGPWGVRFFAEVTPPELRGVPVHPTQLYLLLFDLIALAVAWPRRASGTSFLQAALVLSGLRLCLFAAGIAEGRLYPVVLAALCAIAAWLLVRRGSSNRLEPQP